MNKLLLLVAIVLSTLQGHSLGSTSGDDKPKQQASPLVIGETFTINSKVMGENRRINVYLPPDYTNSPDAKLPALYMLDGGLGEDFLHVAGLMQVSTGNKTMRPFLLIGIENTVRRRDLTGPTENETDRKMAPHVGESAKFRSFIRQELLPEVKTRYRTTNEKAIVGESLAGLFVMETFLLEPELFDTYIAFDPSLWWNNQKLVKSTAARLRERPELKKELYFASSGEPEISRILQELAATLTKSAQPGLHWHYEPFPTETHDTLFHPAALKAFRTVFKPAATERP